MPENGAPSEGLTDEDFWSLFEQSRQRIVDSEATKKLVASGPGTGKTRLFEHLIDCKGVRKDRCLALTFLNNLKCDLEQELCDCACVYTFHGYCYRCLHRNPRLRAGLTDDFRFRPELGLLIGSDWELAFSTRPPSFAEDFQNLRVGDSISFFLARSEYYDAVAYDDSVYRVYRVAKDDPDCRESYDLLIVDEYQDFNLLEVSYLNLLAEKSPILVVGDDDQALYQRLRNSDPRYIRVLYRDDAYENFELSFCARCPEVIVDTFHDVIRVAQTRGKLRDRVPKDFRYFPPLKREDSAKYPKIKIVQTRLQRETSRQGGNYFGRYIAQQIDRISQEEMAEAREGGYPAALVIGSKPYLPQVQHFFDYESRLYDFRRKDPDEQGIDRNLGLAIIDQDAGSNLGWRILLEVDKPDFFERVIKASIDDPSKKLAELVPDNYRDDLSRQMVIAVPAEVTTEQVESTDDSAPAVKLCSFEGAKGLSGQHVFIVGLQDGDLPRNGRDIKDIEICKLLVALTRTRKQCHLLYTTRFGHLQRQPSEFLNWIDDSRKDVIEVDSSYWA